MTDTDWWARGLSGLALVLTAAQFAFNRWDKHKERSASQPRARLALNPNIDEAGWYFAKITYFNVMQEFKITQVQVEKPGNILVASLRKDVGLAVKPQSEGMKIDVNWTVKTRSDTSPTNPVAQANFLFRPTDMQRPERLHLKLTGHYVDGTQAPLSLDVVGSF